MTAHGPGAVVGRSATRVVRWFTSVLAAIGLILLAGVGVAALLASQGSTEEWSRWSDVGQTFGVLSSVISGLALAALVVTFRAQFRELQDHRKELQQHRVSLRETHAELRRSAEANLRMLHVEVLKMSIDDPSLAEVWPEFEPGLPSEVNRQYLYANIVYQYHRACQRVGGYSEEEILSGLRYLFTSQLMRDYWRATRFARTSLAPDGEEHAFAQKANDVCEQYEAVIASSVSRNGSRQGGTESIPHQRKSNKYEEAPDAALPVQEQAA